jgi:hypothetical protein
MEVPDYLYSWLRSTSLFSLPASPSVLPADQLAGFETGHAFTLLIKRLHQLKVSST